MCCTHCFKISSHLQAGTGEIRNADVRKDLDVIAKRVSFDWLRSAVRRIDELVELLRRNIQKSIALDALVAELRGIGNPCGTNVNTGESYLDAK